MEESVKAILKNIHFSYNQLSLLPQNQTNFSSPLFSSWLQFVFFFHRDSSLENRKVNPFSIFYFFLTIQFKSWTILTVQNITSLQQLHRVLMCHFRLNSTPIRGCIATDPWTKSLLPPFISLKKTNEFSFEQLQIGSSPQESIVVVI